MIDDPYDTNFDVVAATMRSVATHIGLRLTDPNAEWVPVLVMQHEDGYMEPPIDISVHLRSDNAKDALLQSLPLFVRMSGAELVALVIPSWASAIHPNADGSIPDWQDRALPRDDPNRVECVTLTVATRGRIESWQAPITRTPVGPRLGSWDHDEGRSTGRIIDALEEAFA